MILCADHAACFPKHWVCDGEADCLDGSDESDCEMSMSNFLAESVTELCRPGEHRCNEARKCIPMNRTCDGHRDCPNGDDEGALCNECQSRSTPCEFECVNTPQGSHCTCPHGFMLNADEFSCTEKDECLTAEAKRCEQYCEDRHNSYQCTCAPGYQLGDDKHSCRLERDHEGKLFVALGFEVRSMPLFESRTSRDGYETVQSLGSHGVVQSIDFLVHRQLLYMTISGSDHQGEVAISVDGLLRVVRENIVGVGQIAVDWIGGNFYFTQRYPSRNPGISVCTQDGFFCRRIIKGQTAANAHDSGKRQYYRGIALHPHRGATVWIESFNNRHKIMMANMDGENVRVLVESKLELPTSISIDLIRSDVYFGDVEREMIERVNMDTRERTIVLTKGVHHPYDLKYFNGFLYWSDWASSSLKVSELRHSLESAYLIHSFTGLPYGLAINHSLYQPSASSNPCALNDCQWMCVAIPNADGELQAKCLCPDGYDSARNGDCLPLSDLITTDTDGSSTEDKNMILDLSHVGVAWMKERCDEGDGCLNGGQCKDVKNEHGRVTKIVCSCESPYEGYRCERLNSIKEQAQQLSGSSRSQWLALIIAFMILMLLAAILIFSYRHIDVVSRVSRAVTSLVERRVRRIPTSRHSKIRQLIEYNKLWIESIKSWLESIKSWISSKLTTPSPRSSSGVFQTEFSNPLFADDSCNSPEEPRSELAYSNPIPDEDTHAAPFSGINVTYTNKFAT
ncbi:hypothetical protein KIN20_032642 [Parelaphostrongylus tenuis]|uniref:EGF-like domain-containing protein n=1 Tax=Parelaphostrongylus tenuis TaxID=148309 RepID=A0AAD5R965_PARTN|nr:hypothetical protein KIN20_032642 [Parelaphostrongylus tenuis]